MPRTQQRTPTGAATRASSYFSDERIIVKPNASPKKHTVKTRIGRKVAILCAAVCFGLPAEASAWQGYQTLWTKSVRSQAPCAASLIAPPSDKERCIRWSPRFAGGPVFHTDLRLIFVGSDDNTLTAFSLRDGTEVYRVVLPGNLASQPALTQDQHVVVGTEDGYAVKIDATNGNIIWSVRVDAEILEPPVVSDKVVFVVTGLDSLYALSLETGLAVWHHKQALPAGMTLRGQSKPALHRPTAGSEVDRVVLGHADGRLSILEASTGKVLKEVELGENTNFSDVDTDPVIAGDLAFAAAYDRGVFALDVRSGEIRWNFAEKSITQLATDGALLVAAGPQKALAIDLKTRKVKWRTSFKKGAPGRIHLKGGRVHLPIDLDRVQILSLATGQPLQALGSGLGVSADIHLDRDLLFYLSNSGHLITTSNALAADALPAPQTKSVQHPYFKR